MDGQIGKPPLESKLIPSMRDGVEMIKMILYLEVRDRLTSRHREQPPAYIRNLSGAVVNELFGASHFGSFAEENRSAIEAELSGLAAAHDKLRIPLTDALRVQFLCDVMEGIGSCQVLYRARDLGVMIMGREVPLPNRFLFLVRKLGIARGLIKQTAAPADSSPEN